MRYRRQQGTPRIGYTGTTTAGRNRSFLVRRPNLRLSSAFVPAHPPVLQVVQCVITRHLLDRAGPTGGSRADERTARRSQGTDCAAPSPRQAAPRQPVCADIDGFSLHAAVRVANSHRGCRRRTVRSRDRPRPAAPQQLGTAAHARVFDIEMQHCPNCGVGELKINANILQRGRPQ